MLWPPLQAWRNYTAKTNLKFFTFTWRSRNFFDKLGNITSLNLLMASPAHPFFQKNETKQVGKKERKKEKREAINSNLLQGKMAIMPP